MVTQTYFCATNWAQKNLVPSWTHMSISWALEKPKIWTKCIKLWQPTEIVSFHKLVAMNSLSLSCCVFFFFFFNSCFCKSLQQRALSLCFFMLFLSFNKLANYVSKSCVFQNIHTIFFMFHQGALLPSLQVLFLFILSFLASKTCVSLIFFHFCFLFFAFIFLFNFFFLKQMEKIHCKNKQIQHRLGEAPPSTSSRTTKP